MVKPSPAQSPVFLFTGNDGYSKNKAIETISASLLNSAAKELDYEVFYGGDAEMREILDCAATIPLSANKKVIIIKDVERLSKEDKARLADYIKNPKDSTCLVLQCADGSFLTEDACLAGRMSIRRFDQPAYQELDSWIQSFLSSACSGKKISPDAIETLKELQGQNLLSLSQELEKLAAFIGDRTQINSDDVEEVVGKSLNASAFDLTDAIEQNDIGTAVRIISELVLTGRKHYEIVGLLCWHLKRQMRARLLRDKGETDYRIADALRIHKRYADAFFGQLKSLDIEKIRLRMQALLEADLDLKRTKYAPSLILEFAVIRMCLI